jgi:hypothetical protein
VPHRETARGQDLLVQQHCQKHRKRSSAALL